MEASPSAEILIVKKKIAGLEPGNKASQNYLPGGGQDCRIISFWLEEQWAFPEDLF
jgi:hypothetical protein